MIETLQEKKQAILALFDEKDISTLFLSMEKRNFEYHNNS